VNFVSATKTAAPARERLLAAADRLFYEEGVNTVGIDRVIEEAGVAKATLYSSFRSKEGLIVAYLRGRLERRQERTMRVLAKTDVPRERILAVFDVLHSFINEPGFNGCAFMNANAEAQPGSAVKTAAREARAWTLSLFTDLARDAGVEDPRGFARRLVLLYDGALVSSSMDHDLKAAVTAKATAAALLDAATPRPRRTRRDS
jgi:AcrR family transcriptional regulator